MSALRSIPVLRRHARRCRLCADSGPSPDRDRTTGFDPKGDLHDYVDRWLGDPKTDVQPHLRLFQSAAVGSWRSRAFN
jgi:hypothetical protein